MRNSIGNGFEGANTVWPPSTSCPLKFSQVRDDDVAGKICGLNHPRGEITKETGSMTCKFLVKCGFLSNFLSSPFNRTLCLQWLLTVA